MILRPSFSRVCLPTSRNSHNVLRRAFTCSALLGAKKKLAVASPDTTSQAPIRTGATIYPNLLTIWNPGSMRNAFIGLIRVLPVALFVSSCISMPATLAVNGLSNWEAIPILLTLAAPMPIMSAILSPYVAQVKILVPTQARQSKEALMSWAKNVREDTMLEFQMQNMFGMKKSSYCEIRELRPVTKKPWRLSNIERIVDPKKDKRKIGGPWSRIFNWIAEPSNRMYVGGPEGMKKSMAPGVWAEILKQIDQKPTR